MIYVKVVRENIYLYSTATVYALATSFKELADITSVSIDAKIFFNFIPPF